MNTRASIAILAMALGGIGLMAASLDTHAGPRAREGARTSVNNAGSGGARATAARSGNANRGSTASRSTNASRSSSVSRSTSREVNVNRDVNIDVDNGWDNDFDHPVAAAAAVGTAVAVTAAAIGSIVYSVPPSCVTTVVNGVAYQQCGSTWYQPQYAGTQVQYVVVNAP